MRSDADLTLPQAQPLDLIWGAKAIAKFLGVTERACFHMLEAGSIPGARQIGKRRWVVSQKQLREFFEEPAHEQH